MKYTLLALLLASCSTPLIKTASQNPLDPPVPKVVPEEPTPTPIPPIRDNPETVDWKFER